MKKLFFKLTVVVIAIITSVEVDAQKMGNVSLGGNLILGTTKDYSILGFGGRLLYNVTNPFRLAGELDYFTKKNYVDMFDLSIYGHYLYPATEGFLIYPSVGLGFVGWRYTTDRLASNSHSNFALSLGGGADYGLTSNLVLNGEFRIKFVSGSWCNFLMGLTYEF